MSQKKSFHINKGIGRTVEFKGLKAQYLFIFAGGLLAVLILTMILYIVGITPYITIGTGALLASLVIWQTFSLNKKYGEHGLMKIAANKRHPKYLIHRKAINQFLRNSSYKHQK